MADVKISELPVATTPDGSEDVAIVQGGATKRTTTKKLADLSRSTVDKINSPVAGATATKAECNTAFKMLPDHDYAKNDEFFLLDGTKMFHVIYMANGDTTEAGTNYEFYEELLTKAL